MESDRDDSALDGQVVAGRYRIARVVTEGANTVIADAIDIEADRPVTVKIVQPEHARDDEFRNKFHRLAAISQALTHPNIASVLDAGEAELRGEPTVFWTVEALGGGSMRDLLDRGRLLTPGQALVVGLEACRALDAAHQKGLFHTELTPSKMLFGADRRLRVTDFGMARLLGESTWQDMANVPTHVARYASPEQALGLPIDAKTDVYALSLSLVESVTGSVPFDADSTQATLAARIDKLLPVSADLGSLAAVLERAGRPEAADRFTAAEFGRALVQAAGQLPKPEPVPILSTGLFDTTSMRRPSDPTGGVARPSDADLADADLDDPADADIDAEPDGAAPANADIDAEPDGAAPADADIDAEPDGAAPADADIDAEPDGAAPADAAIDAEPDGAAPADADIDAEPDGAAPADAEDSAPGDAGDPVPAVDDAAEGASAGAFEDPLARERDTSDDLRIAADAGPNGTAQMPAAVAAAAAAATAPTSALGITSPDTPGPAASAATPAPGPAVFEDPDFLDPHDGTGEIYDDRPPKRRKGPIALIVLLLLAGLGGLAYAGSLLLQTKSFEVPVLAGTAEGPARNQIGGNGWEIVIERERSDAFPEPDTVIRTDPGPGTELEEGETITLVLSDGFEFRTLPDVAGLTADAARAQLEALKLNVAEDPERQFSEELADGSVISWQVVGDSTLQAGAQILPGETVLLTLSQGPVPRDVPDVTGSTLDEATSALDDLQLEIAVGDEVFSDEVDLGRIVSQDPPAGQQIERGGTVTVQVSKGPDVVVLPDLDGLSYADAEELLTESGFAIGSLLGTTDGTFVQLTIEGVEVEPGTEFRRGQLVDVIFL